MMARKNFCGVSSRPRNDPARGASVSDTRRNNSFHAAKRRPLRKFIRPIMKFVIVFMGAHTRAYAKYQANSIIAKPAGRTAKAESSSRNLISRF